MTATLGFGAPGFAQTYGVEILFERAPKIDESAFRSAIADELPEAQVTLDTQVMRGLSSETTFVVFHNADPVKFSDASKPAMTAVMIGRPRLGAAEYAGMVSQTWGWRDEAAARLKRCNDAVFVTDIASSPLPPRRRIALELAVVRAVCASSSGLLVAWHPAQKFLDPTDLDELGRAAVNVRMFRIETEDQRFIMDTLGLAAVGLPDVQIDFTGQRDPNEVAAWLYDVAAYLLDNGNVINSGNTIDGIPTGTKWRCTSEKALARPERLVLDVDPGQAFSERKRKS